MTNIRRIDAEHWEEYSDGDWLMLPPWSALRREQAYQLGHADEAKAIENEHFAGSAAEERLAYGVEQYNRGYEQGKYEGVERHATSGLLTDGDMAAISAEVSRAVTDERKRIVALRDKAIERARQICLVSPGIVHMHEIVEAVDAFVAELEAQP